MPNILSLTVENPDELRNSGAYDTGALMRLQSATTEAGSYADLAGTGSTPTILIVAATRSYTGYDPAGTSSTWYRTRYENTGGTRLSDWSASFQAGDETAGLICSVDDVEQELAGGALTANEVENVIEKIRQVTTAIEGMTGRWFVPRPLSGTTTYRVSTTGLQRIRMSKGIRSLTTLGYARTNQPATGGTYTTIDPASWYLDPPEMDRDAGWPATGIVLASQTLRFASANFGAELTGQFGWAAVPYDIQGVAIRAVVRRYIGKAGGGVSVAVGPAGTEFLLPDMSGADRETLDRYRARAF